MRANRSYFQFLMIVVLILMNTGLQAQFSSIQTNYNCTKDSINFNGANKILSYTFPNTDITFVAGTFREQVGIPSKFCLTSLGDTSIYLYKMKGDSVLDYWKVVSGLGIVQYFDFYRGNFYLLTSQKNFNGYNAPNDGKINLLKVDTNGLLLSSISFYSEIGYAYNFQFKGDSLFLPLSIHNFLDTIKTSLGDLPKLSPDSCQDLQLFTVNLGFTSINNRLLVCNNMAYIPGRTNGFSTYENPDPITNNLFAKSNSHFYLFVPNSQSFEYPSGFPVGDTTGIRPHQAMPNTIICYDTGFNIVNSFQYPSSWAWPSMVDMKVDSKGDLVVGGNVMINNKPILNVLGQNLNSNTQMVFVSSISPTNGINWTRIYGYTENVIDSFYNVNNQLTICGSQTVNTVNSLVVDRDDFIYLTGSGLGMVQFANFKEGTTTGWSDRFCRDIREPIFYITKLDRSGNVLWLNSGKLKKTGLSYTNFNHSYLSCNGGQDHLFVNVNNLKDGLEFQYEDPSGQPASLLLSDTLPVKKTNIMNSFYGIVALPNNRIIKTVISPDSFCTSTPITVSFEAIGKYPKGNKFYVELSDSTGGYLGLVTRLDSVSIDNDSGRSGDTIGFTFTFVMPPVNISSNDNFRLRVVASNPYTVGASSEIDLYIVNAYAGEDTTICSGTYELKARPTTFAGKWKIIEGIANISDLYSPSATIDNFQSDSLVFTWEVSDSSIYCTAIDSIKIYINPVQDTTVVDTIVCISDSITIYDNVYLMNDTIYHFLKKKYPPFCDSLLIYKINFNRSDTINLQTNLCRGGSLDFNGKLITNEGLYSDTLSNIFGCDSIVNLEVSFLPYPRSRDSIIVCEGNSFSWQGRDVFQAGLYSDTIQTAEGCDSIVELALEVKQLPVIEFDPEVIICPGEFENVAYDYFAEVSTEIEVIGGQLINASDTELTISWNRNSPEKAIRIIATDGIGCQSEIVREFQYIDSTEQFRNPIIDCPEIILEFQVPNVITPNNDGFNDQLIIPNLEFYQPLEITIYDRWGREVYSNKNYTNDWGPNAPAGTYYYQIAYANQVVRGWVMVLGG